VDAERPAAKPGGLLPGDKIVAVNGKPVKRFAGQIDSVTWEIVSSQTDDIKFDILRDGKAMQVTVHAPTATDNKEFQEWADASWLTKVFKRPPFRKVGIGPAVSNLAVYDILPNSPADLAGFKKGDLIRTLEGARLYSPQTIEDRIEKNPGKAVKLGIERDGQQLELSVTPRKPDEPKSEKINEILGMAYQDKDAADRHANRSDIDHPTPWSQISDSLRTTFSTLGALISRDSTVQASHMSSAIGIISIYHQLFSIENGWMLILWFTVVLNVNLAILNMLPLPVLDGGHITMALIETVRRKPLKGRIVEYVQASFAVLLLSFMVWVMLKDVGSWFNHEKEGGEIKFYPPSGESAKSKTN
jgi:regulator of sigma E protease